MTTSFINPLAGKGNSSPPPAPDYTGAAQATQRSQMVSQNTPYGSLKYFNDPSSPSGFGSNVTLSPTGQRLLDLNNQISTGLGDQAVGGLARVGQAFSQPFDFGSVQDVQDKAYGAMTARLDPQWQMQQAQMETKLRNQGIPVGSEAWQNEMRTFNQAKNDAYQQANLGAIQTAPQTFQLASALRTQPLNELNALRSGSQVTTPQFTPQPGANYLGATQAAGQYAGDIYNAKTAQQNAMKGGLANLGGSLGAAMILA